MNPIIQSVARLRRLLRRRGQSREDAEDLVQEAFLRLQVYCNEGNEVRSTEALLTRITLNLAANARLANRARRHERQAGLNDLELLVDTSPTPDEVFAAEECLSQIEGILRGLNRRTRDIFFMHRLDGLSYSQIADHFDISVSAIEKHIATAMSVLGPFMHKKLQGL